MSITACLFFVDNGGSSVFKKTEKMIDELTQTSSIYKGGPYSCHILSIDSVEMISESLRSMFRYLKCTSEMITSCSAWCKIKDIIDVHQLNSGILTLSVDPNPFHDPEPDKLKIRGRKVKVKKMYQTESEFDEPISDILREILSKSDNMSKKALFNPKNHK